MSDKTLQFPAPEMLPEDASPYDHSPEEWSRSLRARRKEALEGMASGKLRMTDELRACLDAIDEELANS